MLGDLAVGVEAEDVKGDLLAGSGEVVDVLQKDVVAVLKGPDVLDRGRGFGGGQTLDGAYKGVLAGAVGQVVLDVVLVEQLARRLRIAGGEGVDEGERLVDVALSVHGGLGGRLIGLGGGGGSWLRRITAAAGGQQTGGHGEGEYDCQNFFHDDLPPCGLGT